MNASVALSVFGIGEDVMHSFVRRDDTETAGAQRVCRP